MICGHDRVVEDRLVEGETKSWIEVGAIILRLERCLLEGLAPPSQEVGRPGIFQVRVAEADDGSGHPLGKVNGRSRVSGAALGSDHQAVGVPDPGYSLETRLHVFFLARRVQRG